MATKKVVLDTGYLITDKNLAVVEKKMKSCN